MNALVQLALGGLPPGFRARFPEAGEFARAAPTLARLAREQRLPAEVVLQLFAYEVIERTRELGEQGCLRLAAPFWPPVLFEAQGLGSQAWPELARLLPLHELSTCEPRPDWLEAERVRLGLPPLMPALFRAALERQASEGGWRRRRLAPPALAGEPERSTAAALLVRAGQLLLERRPPDARVTPGVWDIPGGHVEVGESPQAALVRELREELGLEVRSCASVFVLDALEPPAQLRYRHHFFRLRACDGEVRAREGQELAWVTVREALARDDLAAPTGYALQELYETGALGTAPSEA
jgi:8-oxo-dGTP diphosphatase